MVGFRLRPLPSATVAVVAVLLLAGCASQMSTAPAPEAAAPSGPPLPSSIPAENLVGRWGLAAYHKPEDRARTEAAARGQCKQPYTITRGPTGGVIMHLADQSQPTELILKGGPNGQNFVGPPAQPGGAQLDREITSFDGNVVVLRWVDQEVAGRYGTMVYVRCGATPDTPKKRPVAKKKAPAAPPPAAEKKG